MFQTNNSVRSTSLSLKYLRFTPTGCKERIIKCEFAAKSLLSCLLKHDLTIRDTRKLFILLTYNLKS